MGTKLQPGVVAVPLRDRRRNVVAHALIDVDDEAGVLALEEASRGV